MQSEGGFLLLSFWSKWAPSLNAIAMSNLLRKVLNKNCHNAFKSNHTQQNQFIALNSNFNFELLKCLIDSLVYFTLVDDHKALTVLDLMKITLYKDKLF